MVETPEEFFKKVEGTVYSSKYNLSSLENVEISKEVSEFSNGSQQAKCIITFDARPTALARLVRGLSRNDIFIHRLDSNEIMVFEDF